MSAPRPADTSPLSGSADAGGGAADEPAPASGARWARRSATTTGASSPRTGSRPAHATAAEDRLKQQHTGSLWALEIDTPWNTQHAPSDGLDPDMLKHIWRSGIVQSVE